MIIQDYDFSRYDYTIEETLHYVSTVVKSKYNAIHAEQIFAALELAQQVYGEKCEYTSVPYILHAMRIALMLIEHDRNVTSKVFTASLLHDTIGDNGLTHKEIEQMFGPYVVHLVETIVSYHLYEIQGLHRTHIDRGQSWQEVFLESHEARAIITFEALDNMLCWKAIPTVSPARKNIMRWVDEAQTMLLPLAHATNKYAHVRMHQEYMYYVH